MKPENNYYITTAIAYTSRKPHIGNSYEIVLTDAIARYQRLNGKNVFFQTGTDEHGQKIEELAEAAGISPKAYVDGVAGEIKSLWDLMNCSYDKFIRTTDPEHEAVVKKIFKSSTTRATSTKASTKAGTAPPARASGPRPSSRTATAPTADGR